METVEDQAQRRMIGGLDDLPGMFPCADVMAPGQRLEPDPQAACSRAFRHLRQIGCCSRVVVDGRGGDIATDQQKVGAELLHDVELAFGAVHVAGALRLRHRLEVAERLEAGDRQAEAFCQIAHVLRRAVERKKVVLEDFDPVEADGGGGLQLFGQRAAEGDGGDRLRQRRDEVGHQNSMDTVSRIIARYDNGTQSRRRCLQRAPPPSASYPGQAGP